MQNGFGARGWRDLNNSLIQVTLLTSIIQNHQACGSRRRRVPQIRLDTGLHRRRGYRDAGGKHLGHMDRTTGLGHV